MMGLPPTIQWYELLWVGMTLFGVVFNALALTATLGDGLAVHEMRHDPRFLTDHQYQTDYRMRRIVVEMDVRVGAITLWLQVILFAVSASSLATEATAAATAPVVVTRVLRTVAYTSIPLLFTAVGWLNLRARRRLIAIYEREHIARLRGETWDGQTERRRPPAQTGGEH